MRVDYDYDVVTVTIGKEDNLGKGRRIRKLYLPHELVAQVADYMSARDQLSIRLLCKGVNRVLPKVILLNLNHFKDSFIELELRLESWHKRNGPVNCKLNPLVVQKEPFALLQFIHDYFKEDCLDEDIALFDRSWKRLMHPLMGESLKATMVKVLQQPNHPKFSLLSLPIAAFSNSIPAMQFLLLPANRIKIHKDDYQLSMLYACASDSPEALKILLDLNDQRADPAYQDNVPIIMAAQAGNSSCVQLLLQDQRVNPADNRNMALFQATRNQRMATFLLLLRDTRVDPSDDGETCISTAAAQGHLEMFSILLNESRVSPASNHNACIRYASEYGHLAIVKLLLADPRVDASAKKNEALNSARDNEHFEIVALLEEHLRSRGLPLS